jgi:hypothetical protein
MSIGDAIHNAVTVEHKICDLHGKACNDFPFAGDPADVALSNQPLDIGVFEIG